MGFGEKWCGWIKECVSTVAMSVLINGSATKEFQTQKGIRQGDPLSPFLFNIVVEALNILLERARTLNIIHGIQIGSNGVILSHLQFADDTILFCNNDRAELANIKRVLRCFQLMSGLKINFSKSSVCGVKISDQDVKDLALVMGCKIESLPIKYLGLPLGANPKRIKTWEPVLDRMGKKLNVWSRRFNSTGGRLTLLNSNFGHLPIYFMSIFKLPVAVAQSIEKLQRQFFWGDSVEKRKLHLVKWDVIAKKKEYGGLGVKNLNIQNLALLAKWWWRFSNDKDSLWVKVIRGKYNLPPDCWFPRLPASGQISNIWSDICSIGNVSSPIGPIIQEGFKVQVGSGRKTLFWDVVWLGDEALKGVYPRLYSISTQKGHVVSDIKEEGGADRWNLTFGRRLYDWEKCQEEELQQRLHGIALDPSKQDSVQWKWSSNRCFSVKSLYGQWEQGVQIGDEVLGSLWKNLSPPKVEIFSWLALQGRVATRSVLAHRNMLQEGQVPLCPLCSLSEETPKHLFLHCMFSWNTWSSIMQWWQVVWVCPSSLTDLAIWWFGNSFRNLEKHMWEVTFFASLWSLWLARNDLIFNNVSRSASEVGELIKTRVAMWMKAKFDIKVYSVEDFRSFLGGIRKLKL